MEAKITDKIKLNDIWLEKFGFERDTYGYWEINEIGHFSILEEVNESGITEYIPLKQSLCDTIEYVHELQSLYFKIKGKELKLKK